MSDSDDKLREMILDFMRKFYTKNNTAPSISAISKKIKGANTRKFYLIFPGGIKEACIEAEIEPPRKSIESTAHARKGKSTKAASTDSNPIKDTYTLTEQQMQRLRTISHLEKGKAPSKVIDELLEYDSSLRLEFKLKNDDLNQINEFIKSASRRGWDRDSLLNMITKIWNAGFNRSDYNGEKLEHLSDVLCYLSPKNSIDNIDETIEGLLLMDFHSLTPDEKVTFKNIILEINKNKIDSRNFLKLGKSYKETIKIAKEYVDKTIGLDEAIRRINKV